MRFLTALLPFALLSMSRSQDTQVILEKFPETLPNFARPSNSLPSLSDLLTIEQSASIWHSYARETSLAGLFSGDTKLTLLVPTNRAVMALARKPHQSPKPVDQDIEITEEEFDNQSKANVERWISAHIIPKSPIDLETKEETMLDGRSVKFASVGAGSEPKWARTLVDGSFHIVSKKEASNGVLYLVDGTISLD